MTSLQAIARRLNLPPSFIFKAATEARAFDVEHKLENIVRDGLLREQNLRGRVLDIGAGYLGSYSAFSRYSNDVYAVEAMEELASTLLQAEVIDRSRLVIAPAADLLIGQEDGSYNLVAVFHLYGRSYSVPVMQLHRRIVNLLMPGGQAIYTAQQDALGDVDYLRLFRKLPAIKGTTSQIIKDYPIGPDSLLFILTKDLLMSTNPPALPHIIQDFSV